jgi:CheY-like chemotaxis protein
MVLALLFFVSLQLSKCFSLIFNNPHFSAMNAFAKKRILVLDDDKIQHLILKKRIALLDAGVELVFFGDTNSALDFIKSSAPDVVISDLNLNGTDGWQFLEQVNKLNFHGPFYLLSGSIDPGDRNRALKDSRISGFFEKPILESDLNYILGI